jgi:hypothetical protein
VPTAYTEASFAPSLCLAEGEQSEAAWCNQISLMSQDQQLVFLRDLADVEPPRDRYSTYEEEDIYRLVPRPQWTGLEDEIWTPRSQEHDPQLERVKALMKRNAAGASSSGEDSPTASAFSGMRIH